MNIVFDFGGVLLRWRPLALIRQTLPRRAMNDDQARDLAQAVFQSFGGDWAEFDRGALQVDELVHRISQRTGLGADEVLALVQAVPGELQPLPASVALLPELAQAGHRLFYLSNMPAPYADHIEREHGFLRHFADGIFSARVGLIKPDPAIFQLAQARFGVVAAKTLFLDDHAGNVEAARARGWQALRFEDAPSARQDLVELGLLPGQEPAA